MTPELGELLEWGAAAVACIAAFGAYKLWRHGPRPPR